MLDPDNKVHVLASAYKNIQLCNKLTLALKKALSANNAWEVQDN